MSVILMRVLSCLGYTTRKIDRCFAVVEAKQTLPECQSTETTPQEY